MTQLFIVTQHWTHTEYWKEYGTLETKAASITFKEHIYANAEKMHLPETKNTKKIYSYVWNELDAKYKYKEKE